MESTFQELHGRRFDVVVVGGGINGASAAQNLAAEGYNCLVVDKGDFGSGATSRSSRMLHIGLRYFEAENPVGYFLRRPGYLIEALRGARRALRAVHEHTSQETDLIFPYRMCFPVYKNSDFRTWHLRAGLGLLDVLGGRNVPLDSEILTSGYAQKVPFFSDMRDADDLQSIALYNEFKFDWPERFCIDMLLDAEKNGATLANYCEARIVGKANEGDRPNDDWVVSLFAPGDSGDVSINVTAPIVLNLAGTWTDSNFPDPLPEPIVHTTKGSHIVVELPETYEGFGIAGVNKLGTPFYVLPIHKNLFSVGVTELPFSGDASDVTCTDEEVDFLLDEFNSLLPGCRLDRKDVVSTWSGVRPLSSTGDGPETRVHAFHDMSAKGYPGIFALTGAPIMGHRHAGREVLKAIMTKLRPSGSKGAISHEAFQYSKSTDSPPLLPDEPDVRIADLESCAATEHVKTLTDVLLRRTNLAWRRRLSADEALRAAEIVGPLLSWTESEQSDQVRQFMQFQDETFRRPNPSP